MATTELERLNERIDTLTARRERLLNLEKQRQRKKDTRCKILIGAQLLAMAKKGDEGAAEMLQRVIASVPERAAQAFEGWER